MKLPHSNRFQRLSEGILTDLTGRVNRPLGQGRVRDHRGVIGSSVREETEYMKAVVKPRIQVGSATLEHKYPAPKARNVKARGKCRAKRSTTPLERWRYRRRALKAQNSLHKCEVMALFQSLRDINPGFQGRRASPSSALAPGFYIPRLWRSKPATKCETNQYHGLKRALYSSASRNALTMSASA